MKTATAECQVAPDFQISFTRPAFTVAEFAKACGLGETTIREHIAANKLVLSYPTRTKGIITLEEGLRWLRTLPSEPLPVSRSHE